MIPSQPQSDEFWMQLALAQASQAALHGDVPVGALLVRNHQVIASSGNRRELDGDPLGHAEIDVLRQSAQLLGTWRLIDTELFVTVEPCLMCTGAVYQARVRRVIFGCANPKGGALQFIAKNSKTLALNHTIEWTAGVMQVACAQLMTDFFTRRRISGNMTE